MKTMTEFIMEQEAPTDELVCESFDENELVSNFMALQAASANLNCMFEYATIANFCEANELKMPEAFMQEGFIDAIKSLGKNIGDWFKRVIEWFKGIIKGTASTFAKAKISDTIAKLRQYDGDKGELSAELSGKIKYVYYGTQVLWGFLVKFKEILDASMDALSDINATMGIKETEYARVMQDADAINDALKKFAKSSGWIDSNGKIKTDAFEAIATAAEIDHATEFGTIDNSAATLPVSDVIKYLERINKYNIPKKGNDLLKQLNATDKKFVQITKIPDPNSTTGGTVPAADIKANNANFDNNCKEMTKKIKDMANYLATAYDAVTTKFADVTAKAVKDIEVSDKEKFNKDAKKVESESKRDASDISSES